MKNQDHEISYMSLESYLRGCKKTPRLSNFFIWAATYHKNLVQHTLVNHGLHLNHLLDLVLDIERGYVPQSVLNYGHVFVNNLNHDRERVIQLWLEIGLVIGIELVAVKYYKENLSKEQNCEFIINASKDLHALAIAHHGMAIRVVNKGPPDS